MLGLPRSLRSLAMTVWWIATQVLRLARNDGNLPTPFIPLRRGRGNSQNYHLQREGALRVANTLTLKKKWIQGRGLKKANILVLREGA
ncbi:hypothetical protein [Helicobacter macacae]|uniref:hypothetical protein n=1 Tax=Helicobacter macacae TaxID=398626 RepID=UPI00040EDAAF|nr:hypothetical protein [Helicobacter macacae]